MRVRLYSLFEKIDGKYIRQTGLAFRKSTAVSVFQSRLLGGFFDGKNMSLRVVKNNYSSQELEAVAAGSALTIHDCCKLLDKQNT